MPRTVSVILPCTKPGFTGKNWLGLGLGLGLGIGLGLGLAGLHGQELQRWGWRGWVGGVEVGVGVGWEGVGWEGVGVRGRGRWRGHTGAGALGGLTPTPNPNPSP